MIQSMRKECKAIHKPVDQRGRIVQKLFRGTHP